MKFVKDGGTNLNAVKIQGLPTMKAGDYVGIFVGSTKDDDGQQWVTVSTDKEAHIEMTELDVSKFSAGQSVKFTIAVCGGASAHMKGSQYQLVSEDGTKLTDWIGMADLYNYIKDNNIKLAELKLAGITET